MANDIVREGEGEGEEYMNRSSRKQRRRLVYSSWVYKRGREQGGHALVWPYSAFHGHATASFK